MRKILSIAMCVTLIWQLTACGDKETKDEFVTTLKGTELSRWFNNSENKKIWNEMTDNFRDKFGSFENFNAYQQQIIKMTGSSASFKKNIIFSEGDYHYYDALFKYSLLPEGQDGALFWVLNDKNIRYVDGFEFRVVENEANSNYLNYKSKSMFDLPFSGDWMVLWGGRSSFENYHADTKINRFATDFVVFKNGKHFSGEGQENNEHFCFGKIILSPASGTVISLDTNIADNIIPNENEDNPLGNYVGIDHGNGEFSLLAHLKKDSVSVMLGEYVEQGAVLGECGNSGLSDLPHLHFHVQDNENFHDFISAESLPVQYTKYKANGKTINNGEVKRGERVSDS